MSVLASEDEIEELASELLDVAKVAKVLTVTARRLPSCACLMKTAAVADGGLRRLHLGALEPAGRQQKEVSFCRFTVMSPGRNAGHVRVTCVHRELVHLVKHVCETLKVKRLDCILVIPPAVTR